MSILELSSESPPEPRVEPRAGHRPSRLLAVGSVLGGTALIACHAMVYGSWIVDDAAITFSYARSVAEGFGPVLQPGQQPVEGFSDPAWLGLLAIGRLLGLFDRGTIFGIPDYVLFPKALGLLCCAGILILSQVAARRVTRRPWVVTLVVGAGLAAIPSFVIWSFSGLENPLYAVTVVGLAVTIFCAVLDGRLLSHRTAVAVGVLAAVAALTRPDGVVYAAAYPIVVLVRLSPVRLWSGARAIGLSSAAFMVPFGGYLAWRIAEFGRLTPMTAVAKNQRVPEVSDLARIGEVVAYAGAPVALAVMLVLGMALAGDSAMRNGLLALLVPLGLALVAYAVLEPDWMAELRFATPVWALGMIAGTLAATRVLARGTVRVRAVLAVVLVVALLPSAVVRVTGVRQFRVNPTVPVCVVAERLGRVINGYADRLGIEHGTLLVPDIGGSALTSRLAIVDLAGLADARIARSWAQSNMPALRDYVFDEVRPSIVHTRGYWSTTTGLVADARLDRDYVPIYLEPGDNQSGDWVRKSLVPGQAQLDAARAYAAAVVPGAWQRTSAAPRGRCGPALARGQVAG